MLYFKTAIPALFLISMLASKVAGQDCIVGVFTDSSCSGNVAEECDDPEHCNKRIEYGEIMDFEIDENRGYYYYGYDSNRSEYDRAHNYGYGGRSAASEYGQVIGGVDEVVDGAIGVIDELTEPEMPDQRTCEDGSLNAPTFGCQVKKPVTVPNNLGPGELQGCMTETSVAKLDACRLFDKEKDLYIKAWKVY
ncbi:hypothetical protein BG004_001976 [Podila humilis]|nr:hypothetical protein BG004_001976 [Podila humilis]